MDESPALPRGETNTGRTVSALLRLVAASLVGLASGVAQQMTSIEAAD